jgi:alpha-L-fucosidase
MDLGKERVGDYGTPEQEIPATGFGSGVYWESCMTMNETWGFKKSDLNWKSTTQLVRNLIDCASKGGNYLLNVGPTGEGLIPEASVQRLAEIGRWMKANGEAIYQTSASPFPKLPFDGRCTAKANKLFLHVFTWPSDGLHLTTPRPVVGARVLNGHQRLAVTTVKSADNDRDTLVAVSQPAELDPMATVVELILAP